MAEKISFVISHGNDVAGSGHFEPDATEPLIPVAALERAYALGFNGVFLATRLAPNRMTQIADMTIWTDIDSHARSFDFAIHFAKETKRDLMPFALRALFQFVELWAASRAKGALN